MGTLNSVCCSDTSIHGCPQAYNTSWSCSNKLGYKTQLEKLQICPFNASECGTQSVGFQNPGDSECLRLNSLSKGAACLYKVTSLCGTPTVKLNDSLSFAGTLMLSNVSSKAPATQVYGCSNQRYVLCGQCNGKQCNCSTVNGFANITQSQCNQCGKQGSQTVCNCPIPYPRQTLLDSYCQCQQTGNASLNCTQCTPGKNGSQILSQSQCKCVNATNAQNQTYLSCVCSGAQQCPTPPSPACLSAYSCVCLQGTGSGLGCMCTNPLYSTQAVFQVDANQCSCTYNPKMSQYQNCECCLSANNSAFLIPNFQCQSGIQGPSMQTCTCFNSTTGLANCSCSSPSPNALATASTPINNNTKCLCSDNLPGNKSCKCCLATSSLPQASNLTCPATAQPEQCRCYDHAGGIQSCNCTSSRRPGLTFPVTITPCQNTSKSTNASLTCQTDGPCQCSPRGDDWTEPCTCCIFDSQLPKQSTSQSPSISCSATSNLTKCSCSSANGALSCLCVNKYQGNLNTSLSLSPKNCSCQNKTSSFANASCSCCLEASQLNIMPLQCPYWQVNAACDECVVNQTSTQCGLCRGFHALSTTSEVMMANTIPIANSQCSCVSLSSQSGSYFFSNTYCSCCFDFSYWLTATPLCSSPTSLESCSCNNTAVTLQGAPSTSIVSSVTCIVTGYNGELCAAQANTSTTHTWSNAFACYAQAQCTYQAPLGQCGWTVTPELAQCLASPPIADPKSYQNLTTRASQSLTIINPSNSLFMTNTSVLSNWSCNCLAYPLLPVTQQVSPSSCGCAQNNQSCQCCITPPPKNQVKCASGLTASNCSCTLFGDVNSCLCNPSYQENFQLTEWFLDPSLCVGGICCLNLTAAPSIEADAAPSCSGRTNALQACTCSKGSKFNCSCNAIAGSLSLSPSNCECINFLNGSYQSTGTCLCCAPIPMQCPANTTEQTCTCTTKKSVSNCTCFQNGTNIGGQFLLNSSLCGSNSNNTTCCLSSQQVKSQAPLLECTYQTQNCQCTNATTNGTTKNCSCLRVDNGITGVFQISQSQCLCGNASSCACCVTSQQVQTQIPRVNCTKVGANLTAQFCSCANQSSPKGQNKSMKSNMTCLCARTDFLVYQTFNMTPSNCLCQDGSSCECCLTPVQALSLIPSLSCDNTQTPQIGCSCTNTTKNSGVSQNCTCPIAYQNANYTVYGLTTKNSNCMCNTTTCGCCLSQAAILNATDKQCITNQTKTVCGSCIINPSKGLYNCSSCQTQANGYVVNNQTYSNPASCQCRSPSVNCTCCLNQALVMPAQPKCSGAAPMALPFCQCTNLSSNGVASGCECVANNSQSIAVLYQNATAQNCSCLSVTFPGTSSINQCACCSQQLPQCPATSVLANNCSCQERYQVSANSLTLAYTCDCLYQSTLVPRVNLPLSACGYTSNYSSCCLPLQAYQNALAPTCPATQLLAQCQCLNGTANMSCNCTGQLISSKATVSNNWNMTVPKSQCGCYQNGKVLSCACCMNETALTQLPAKVCPSNKLNSSCSCPAAFSNATTCGCTLRATNLTIYGSATLAQSDCSCISQVSTNGTASQLCSCCVSRNNPGLNPPAPFCNASTSTSQNCNCSIVKGIFTCDCKKNGTNQVTQGIRQDSSKCSCLNQTVAGQPNQANCTCCVQNPPPTYCETLANPSNSSNVPCQCNYQLVSGQMAFVCNCSSLLANTTQRGMVIYDQRCCCQESFNALTGMGYQACNCSLPSNLVQQRCSCNLTDPYANTVNCTCTDCNEIVTQQQLYNSRCRCQPLSNDTSTYNATACTCQVAFQGLCPSVDMKAAVTDSTCDASNGPSFALTTTESCGQTYQYLVAVVASGSDPLLMQVQSRP